MGLWGRIISVNIWGGCTECQRRVWRIRLKSVSFHCWCLVGFIGKRVFGLDFSWISFPFVEEVWGFWFCRFCLSFGCLNWTIIMIKLFSPILRVEMQPRGTATEYHCHAKNVDRWWLPNRDRRGVGVNCSEARARDSTLGAHSILKESPARVKTPRSGGRRAYFQASCASSLGTLMHPRRVQYTSARFSQWSIVDSRLLQHGPYPKQGLRWL